MELEHGVRNFSPRDHKSSPVEVDPARSDSDISFARELIDQMVTVILDQPGSTHAVGKPRAAVYLHLPKIPRAVGVRRYILKHAEKVLIPPQKDSEVSCSVTGAVKDSRDSGHEPEFEFDEVLIDEADLQTVQHLRLYVENGYCWIADYGEIEPGGREPQRSKTLHQHLMRDCRPDGELAVIVDHVNGDTLDCRRSNLRWASHKLNSNNKVVNRDFLKDSVAQASEILEKEGTQLAWEPTQRSHPFIGFDHKRKRWLAKPFVQFDLGAYSELLDAIKVVNSWIGEHEREDLSGMTAFYPVTQALGAKRPRLR